MEKVLIVLMIAGQAVAEKRFDNSVECSMERRQANFDHFGI
jgi:hypothetical protein